jgi:hypothetical protein
VRSNETVTLKANLTPLLSPSSHPSIRKKKRDKIYQPESLAKRLVYKKKIQDVKMSQRQKRREFGILVWGSEERVSRTTQKPEI